MKIAYHIPHVGALNAYRTIYQGFKNAFTDMGHEVSYFTAGERLRDFLEQNTPDIFFTATHFYYQKFIDFDVLNAFRKDGLKVFVKIDFWESPMCTGRINEAGSLKNDVKTVRLIRDGLFGDVFYHVVEQGDPRMRGFEDETGCQYETIPLAADKITLLDQFAPRFETDISYIGTNLPQKRGGVKEYLFPLKQQYRTKIYGQDWTSTDRLLGLIQKGGQFFNVPGLRSLRKPKLSLGDEGRIYKSSAISINIHEDYQRVFGGDCNERTFKIPLCGGFEITDDVACIRKYFVEGSELVIAKDRDDWYEKIAYYMEHPAERDQIIARGKERVLRDHTYHNRVEQILDIYKAI